MSAPVRSELVPQHAAGLLAPFSLAGVLNPADVHTAETVCRIGGESDENVRLALALTVRALRNGSVCIDLGTVHRWKEPTAKTPSGMKKKRDDEET